MDRQTDGQTEGIYHSKYSALLKRGKNRSSVDAVREVLKFSCFLERTRRQHGPIDYLIHCGSVECIGNDRLTE